MRCSRRRSYVSPDSSKLQLRGETLSRIDTLSPRITHSIRLNNTYKQGQEKHLVINKIIILFRTSIRFVKLSSDKTHHKIQNEMQPRPRYNNFSDIKSFG